MSIKPKNMQGATLISLLIGVGLGAFVIIVMLQIFSSTRANYKLAQNLDEMNNVLRYTSITMNDVISQAGYRTPNGTTGVLPDYSTAFQPFGSTLTGPGGSNYSSASANSDDPAGVVLSYFPGQSVIISSITNDKLWAKFQGDAAGRIRTCNDLYGIAGSTILTRFYSQQTTVSGNTVTGYYCETQSAGGTYTYSSSTPSGTELIPTALFDRSWIRYGEGLTTTGYIDRWALGPDVLDRSKVYAIRVAFLIHSRDDVRSEDVTQTFNVFGDTVSRTDKKLYRLHMFTIMLPNAPGYPLASLVVTP